MVLIIFINILPKQSSKHYFVTDERKLSVIRGTFLSFVAIIDFC